MNLVSAFAKTVQQSPRKTALFWGEREYSYRHFWDDSFFVSQQLTEKFQVKPGDRVGLWLKNCPEFVPGLFGILQARAVVVPINNFLKTEEVKFILQDAGIDVVVTDHELGKHLAALTVARPHLKLFKVESLSGKRPHFHAEPEPLLTTSQKDLAVLIYTSGTTGHPKGAMLSHGNLLHNVESCQTVLKTVAADRFAVMLPMFHSYMLTVGTLLPLLTGGSIVLIKSLHPVRNAIQEITHRRASILPAIPQFYKSIVQAPGVTSLPVRLCVSGAAPLPAQVLTEFETRFGIPLIEGYGLSEASPVVTKNPLDGTRKPGSIGLPIPKVEVSIQDENGNLLGSNETGEVCVKGGNVMQGYWKMPEETAKVIRNGWLLTGDIGYRDSEGYYFITDRKKDMLLVNGINVYPREIEEILYQYPGVKEAAVIGKPDPRRGEQPVAFVAPDEGVTLEEHPLWLFMRKRLADYKVPKRIVLLAALPRNATGKILKTSLRQVPLPD